MLLKCGTGVLPNTALLMTRALQNLTSLPLFVFISFNEDVARAEGRNKKTCRGTVHFFCVVNTTFILHSKVKRFRLSHVSYHTSMPIRVLECNWRVCTRA